MLYKKHNEAVGKTLVTSRPLLVKLQEAYVRPASNGRDWFESSTTVWNVDELVRRRVRDWRRLMEETGHSGSRSETMRADHNSVYTGTYSVFPAPLMEWILLRYGGPPGNRVLDAFAGGPPRAMVSSIMGYEYHGFDVRLEQINENLDLVDRMSLENVHYHHGDGCTLKGNIGLFDVGITCPPYYDLERYSSQDDDISNARTYGEFDAAISCCAKAYFQRLKPGAFLCFIVGLFRDRKGRLIDFRSDTVGNFTAAGFTFHQDVILVKNFASAAKRSANAWLGKKLVPRHEHMLVFLKS